MRSLEDKNIQCPKPKADVVRGGRRQPRSGADNARIGMEGFKAATNNPEMFAEAMGMLNDPNAVKEVIILRYDKFLYCIWYFKQSDENSLLLFLNSSNSA